MRVHSKSDGIARGSPHGRGRRLLGRLARRADGAGGRVGVEVNYWLGFWLFQKYQLSCSVCVDVHFVLAPAPALPPLGSYTSLRVALDHVSLAV